MRITRGCKNNNSYCSWRQIHSYFIFYCSVEYINLLINFILKLFLVSGAHLTVCSTLNTEENKKKHCKMLPVLTFMYYMGIIRNKVVETNIRRRWKVKLFISFYNRENKLISIQRVQIQMKIDAIEYVYMNEYLVSISTFACIVYIKTIHI